jgi:hypothetical protein
MNPYTSTLLTMGLTSHSDPSTPAGALWLALTIAAATDPADYSGRTPVREVINRWKTAGYFDSLIGKSLAPLLETVAMRERG